MLISKEISSLVKSFHIWILFFFSRHFCFFSLVLLVTFCNQMHSKWKFGWMNHKMLDEKFDREKTSSNIAQHDVCLLFSYKFCKLSNTSNISSNIETLDTFPLAFRLSRQANPTMFECSTVEWNVGWDCKLI